MRVERLRREMGLDEGRRRARGRGGWEWRRLLPLGAVVLTTLFTGALAVDALGTNQRALGRRMSAGSAQLKRLLSRSALLTYTAPSGELCLVGADGTYPVRLLSPRGWVQDPAWSPDGHYLAFDGDGRIAVANARGHVVWTISPGVFGSLGWPLWSPDAGHIAYVGASAPSRNFTYELMVARPSGADAVGIGGNMDPWGDALDPAWAPDGQRLAFEGIGHTVRESGIFSVRADGGERRLLISGADDPAYSPDGSKLAYDYDTGAGGIYVADADGGNSRLLASAASAYFPAWSPDGTRIAFERLDLAKGWELVVVQADGSGEPVVVSGLSLPSDGLAQPLFSWSPDGKQLAFYREDRALLVANADGTGTRVIVRHVLEGTQRFRPVWRPEVLLPPTERPPCR
jgi:Tol biopolymer transport system component